jgi:tRNA-binding protein
MATISYDDFARVDVRAGTIIAVEDFSEARKPTYKLTIDFGSEIGIKKSSAQITAYYSHAELKGRQVIGVVNFSPKRIGPFVSEVLVLGLADAAGNVVLVTPTENVPNGSKLF